MEKALSFLIVDDDSDDLDFFCEAVNRIDSTINCQTLTDGLAALEFLNNCVDLPDFIFLDLNMPRMGGKECLKKLKVTDRFARIPVIIWSTGGLQPDIDEIIKLGATHFLKKPVELSSLCNEIIHIMEMVRKNEEKVV